MLIFKQIPAVISDIEAIQKSTRPGSQIKYAYRSIDEFMNALNPLLGKHKITVVPEVLENHRDSYKTLSGTTMISVVMKIKYSFFAEDGSSVSAVMIGESFDSGDKASNKAQSVALKYAIMQVFMVPTEDIEDADHYDTSKNVKPIEKKPLVNHAPVVHTKTDYDRGAEWVKEGKTVTEAQLKRMYAIQQKSKMTPEQVAQMIKLRFNKLSSKELTMVEYDEVVSTLEASIEA